MFLLAQTTGQTSFQFARLEQMSEGWQWLVMIVVCIAMLAYVVYMYIRDSVELSLGLTISLTLLRVLAFAGILFYFLDLEKRTERNIVKPSRAIVMVDTSQSMGIRDAESASATSRTEEVVAALDSGLLVNDLRKEHDVVVYRFDESTKPTEIAALPQLPSEEDGSAAEDAKRAELSRSLQESRWLALVAACIFGVSVLAGGVHLIFGARASSGGEPNAWAFLVSVVALIASVVVLAVATLRTPDVGVLAAIGLQEPQEETPQAGGETETQVVQETQVDWNQLLVPQGEETRLGDALRFIVNKERGGTIAGIVVATDGRRNAGVEAEVAINAALDAEIPVFTIGLGSARRPVNLRVVDIEAPQRVYPGDDFTITGYIQQFGVNAKSITVELLSGEANANEEENSLSVEEERAITLGEDGKMVPVEFQVSPVAQGVREYVMRVKAVEEDNNERDNEKRATVEVLERRTRVLLIAGGPTREYRFLRDMLYRDKDTHLEVWLQSGLPGLAQEADEPPLDEFPQDEDELFEFDCIVAFDSDWQIMSEEEIDLLERFVSEKAGGLVVVAGPVYTPEWTRDVRRSPKLKVIQSLYPVVFYTRGSATLDVGRFGGDQAWPLEFTRDGYSSEFLWLEDDASRSEQTWAGFEGIYGYYGVKDPKPGAKVYARFSDPSTEIEGVKPIYWAGQFYGAGRVFFQASGEMWRVRAVDDSYFETYYTKLIRWAAQGRLLRDSSRGILLTDKERCRLGEHVVIRAILQDAQYQPLQDAEVSATLIQPNGELKTLTLKAVQDATREGTYAAQFTALDEGSYRVELVTPGGDDDELLSREVRVVAARTESERPERDDALLEKIAQQTGGEYFVGMQAATDEAAEKPTVVASMKSREQTTYLPGTPDKQFDEMLMTWLMFFIAGVLSLEWLVRRLSKLA